MSADPERATITRTTCPYCGVGCGIHAIRKGGSVRIEGDPDHPANFGRLCAKGLALDETLSLEGRLLHPLKRQADGSLARISWPEAIAALAGGLSRIIDRDGPDSVAFYLSGQLLTEDYYVANKLMKGFIGSGNVDTNSRLCMASSVAGHRRAFGADTVPGVFADFDEADLFVLVGSNAAWCHPVLFRRIGDAKERRGAKLVVVDPRRTATAEDADLFLGIAPGADTVLFSGLLVHLAARDALDRDYIARHTRGFAQALARARDIAPDIESTAALSGLDSADVTRFFDLFAATPRTITAFSQGVNQSAQGTDKVNAIINCHLATGRIGRPGMGPFSLTGQPNAMGGREVGGLANQLAAHMGFDPAAIDRVRRFWKAPRMATREGLKAVDLFAAIGRGEIKALWVMATNPAVSLPRAGAVREALKRLELFAVSDTVMSNDTIHAGAHLLLPAAAWGEKDGTVTNSERRISRQRAFLPLPGEAKPDWWIICEVAKAMGFGAGFGFHSPAAIFREHAALSAFENGGARDFDIGALAGLDDAGYEALIPAQWPLPSGAEPRKDKRFFAEGGFFTPDRLARFVAPERPELKEPVSPAFPFRLNTGRIRDQWHTMTRTGKSPRLFQHLPEPFVEVHPADAAALGLAQGGLAEVRTEQGVAQFKVLISEAQRPGSLFVPIHWSRETASDCLAGALVSAHSDPVSGQPEMKATPARIAPLPMPFKGVVRTPARARLPKASWWTRVALGNGIETRFFSDRGVLFWHDVAQHVLGDDGLFVEALDEGAGAYAAGRLLDGELGSWLAVAPAKNAPSFAQLLARLARASDKETALRSTELGPESISLKDDGPLICACLGVSAAAVEEAVRGGAISLAALGSLLGAGTRCGSCIPELKRFVARAHRSTSAQIGASARMPP